LFLKNYDQDGHIILERNQGEEMEEFLDEEELHEDKINLSGREIREPRIDKLKEGLSSSNVRSESPLRHVILEDAEE